MLIADHLRKEFRDITAVDDLSFSVAPGKIYGLLGPNGAGKTTTIRIILNIIKPTSGNVTFNNEPVTTAIFRHIGYLPEERGLYKKSTAWDVIRYFAELKGLNGKEASHSTEDWLRRLELIKSKNKKIEELSKGNQQKVQFITAVVHNPGLLVLDEPFAGFDPINQQIIKENILNFSKEGKIIILSTHQMDTAEKLCSEILLMNKGKEVLKGDIPSIKSKFGGNYVKIIYSGDPAVLNRNDSVEHIDYYNGYAEIQLRQKISPPAFLKEISGGMDILHFSIIEPTLHKIFIDTVKEEKQ